MFKPTSDRLNYGSIIAPPSGYVLDKAIGTTYSLDLETLTAICISLGLAWDTDSELIKNPISMLNALQKVSDRILIFCEAGQIKMPSKASPLCLLLEKMVGEVCLSYNKKIKRFPAFHPKTWLIVYVNEAGEKLYRYVVLSRNLTFDRSWDVSLVLDGKVQGLRNFKKTEPIVGFTNFLKGQLSKDKVDKDRKRKIINSVLSELPQVLFKTNDKKFTDFEIMPLGIGSDAYDIATDLLFTDTYHEMAIISPFLTDSVIEGLNKSEMGLTGVKRNLITRRSELGKLKAEHVNNFNIYVLKDDIIDGEEALSEEEKEFQKQDIHAKMFLRRKYSDVSLYLGSMNASYAAINSNVEMMVRLDTKNRYLNTDQLLNDIFSGAPDNINNPFELVNILNLPEEEDTSENDKLEQCVKRICRMNPKGYVIANGDKYDVRIEFQKFDDIEGEVLLSPFGSNKSANINRVVEFHELDLLQISQFYKLTVVGEDSRVERIIMVPTIGMPDDRESKIVQSVVASKSSFIEYVAFVLGDDYLLSIMESKRLAESGVYNGRETMMMPAVYEKMLKTSLEEPEKIGEISYLMKMIDDEEIVPEEFRRMYETFKTTLKLK